MIQEKRGMLKKWNLALIIGSWLLSIFGTFITRSGVISSVHSFTQSNVGYFFLGFLIVAGIVSFALYANRLPLLEAEARLESMISREASFLFNNLLLIGIAFSRSEEHTSELQSRGHLVCRLLLEKKKQQSQLRKPI